VLVVAEDPYCAWCKKLHTQLALPAVERALARWTPVAIDVERAADDAQRLGVRGTPALRVLTPQGRLIAGHDGYLEADALLQWLAAQEQQIARTPDELLLANEPPTILEVVRLTQLLAERDAAIREAAIHRLMPHPQAGAAALVRSLAEGNLGTRLAAIEVLGQWQAPLDGLDPWRPQSLSRERLGELEKWAAGVSPDSAVQFRTALTKQENDAASDQIERMLKADAAGAAAAREQLARLGPALLPEVASRIAKAASDDDRARLTALRYRLAAGHALPLRWPGGLERLADRDVTVRHRAADELAALATEEHEPLLLELFSDPDPLVREISLRGLKHVSGNRSTSALTRLLDDPDPNVRAAVLKQLAEDATGELVAKVAEYVQRETDADLVVHALRYFGEVKDRDVTESVLPLLSHASWQVRAEAAQVLAKVAKQSRYSSEVTAEMLAIRKALLKLLDDEDSFVVSKALEGLERVNSASAVEPLVRTVERHPALSPAVTKILANNDQMQQSAIPHLRRFLAHENAAVRAAAIAGLCQADPSNVQNELQAALTDRESRVRIAAADALVAMLQTKRPSDSDATIGDLENVPAPTADAGSLIGAVNGFLRGLSGSKPKAQEVETPPPDASPAAAPADPPANKPAHAPEEKADEGSILDAWLSELYAGKHRAAWTGELVEPLQAMLAAEGAEERVAAALALIPLGRAETAAPVLLAAAREQPGVYPRACQALIWLTWPDRQVLFEQLSGLARHNDQREILLGAMSEAPDARAAGLYWELLARPDFERPLGDSVQSALKYAYFGSRYYDAERITPTVRRRAKEAILPRALAGPTIQRLIAINLLLEYSADDALAAAQKLESDPAAPGDLRADAFQLVLLAQAPSDRTAAAVAALAGDDAQRRKIALRFLAGGAEALSELPATKFRAHTGDSVSHYSNSGEPIIPEPPPRVEAGHVRPLLADADPQVAAYAGYLLALLGETDGLPPLVAHWRSQKEPSAPLDRLVYRAIAVLDDPAYIPQLRTIAARLDKYAVSDFYWTVRIMSGSEILQFRKELREKQGMENLR
jgi:HEAT repeat protein